MSRFPYHFHFEAEREFAEAALFYESHVAGLGASFVIEVEPSIAFIGKHPHSGAPLGMKLRRVIVQNFPYSIIYCHDADDLFLLAVAHHRRRPGYWEHRK